MAKQIACYLSVLILVSFWNLPSLWYPFGEDHALSHLMGKLILEGGVPYRDAIDVKPPGVFYLHALFIRIGGEAMHWVRMADLACLWLTMGFMWWVGRSMKSPFAGLWGAALFGFAHSTMGFWNTGLQESFLLPFLWWSLFMALRGRTGDDLSAFAVCGAFLGVVFWFKYPYALPLGALLSALLLGVLASPEQRRLYLTATALLLCGFLVVVGAGLFYFWHIGALNDMVQITGLHNVDLRIQESFKPFTDLIEGSLWMLESPLFLVIVTLTIAGIWSLLWSRATGGWIFLAYGICMLVAVYLQLRLYRYHWIPFISFLCFILGFAVECIRKEVSRMSFFSNQRWLKYVSIAVVAFLVATSLLYHRENFRRLWLFVQGGISRTAYFATFTDPKMNNEPFVFQDWQVSQVLRGMDLSENTLFIWGFRPLVYYFSGFRPSTAFLHNSALWGRGSQGMTWRLRFEEEFTAHPPAAVLIRLREHLKETLNVLKGLVPRMHAMLMSEYAPVGKIGPFLVYERLGEMTRRDLGDGT
jgi:hypothetical protein